jgi:hypothetical protein
LVSANEISHINPLLGAFRTGSDGTFTVRFGVAITHGRLQVSHIDPGGQSMTERSTYFAQTLTVLYDRLLVTCQAVFVAIFRVFFLLSFHPHPNPLYIYFE